MVHAAELTVQSPELETLDQLLCGGMQLRLIRLLYPSETHFRLGVSGLLRNGEVRLLATDGSEIEEWHWRQLFRDDSLVQERGLLILEITEQGASKVA